MALNQSAGSSRAHGAVVLWLAEIAAIVFISLGIFIWIVDPGKWLVALAAILLSGLCAAKIGRMLVLRGQGAIVPR